VVAPQFSKAGARARIGATPAGIGPRSPPRIRPGPQAEMGSAASASVQSDVMTRPESRLSASNGPPSDQPLSVFSRRFAELPAALTTQFAPAFAADRETHRD